MLYVLFLLQCHTFRQNSVKKNISSSPTKHRRIINTKNYNFVPKTHHFILKVARFAGFLCENTYFCATEKVKQ